MPRKNLSASFCSKVKPGKSRTYYWDTDVKGLGLMVSKTGHKSFVFQYRDRGQPARRIKLGDYGHDLTLTEARLEAADQRALLRTGRDPSAEKKERRGDWTFGDLYDYFMDGVLHPVEEDERIGGYRNEPGKFPGTSRSPNSIREYENLWERYILPAWGRRLVKHATIQDLEVLHHDVSKVSPVQADRVVKVLRRPFRLARKHGQYPADKVLPPEGIDTAGLNRPGSRAGTRYSDDELGRIGKALLSEDLVGQRAGVALAFLSGMRPPHEIVQATWPNLVHDGRILELPETKSGPRAAYLGKRAAEIIARQPATGDDAILTSPFGGAYGDLRYQWQKIRKAAKLPAGRRLYDARHTYKSIGEDLGIPRWRVDVLMGHSKAGAGTSGIYSHPEHQRLLLDADRISEEIWRLLAADVEESRVEALERRVAAG